MNCYIDCHAHLSANEFDEDIDVVLSQAKEVGVGAILAVTEFKSEFEKVISLSERFPDIVAPCLGIHPVQGDPKKKQRPANPEDLVGVEEFIRLHREKLFAIGEIGLDLTPRYFDPNKKDILREGQYEVFLKQIELAKELDLPVNVHSRSAGRPTINFLKENGASKVLLHAFDGKPSVAMQGVDAGYYFSFPPSIIRSEQKQKLAKVLPLSNILLETDSPALGVEKQARNEPKFIQKSCEMIAKIKGLKPEQVMVETTKNALKLFPKLQRYIRI
ncbi:putative deoxyribonuclease TATDN3 isoform X1 [Dendronephthya gigantea]|uniref:putative deoxyribonuclease TATDN3 isoform X1 n=1 Tax=Dendronephthya gigantea TaxID=151771 RepID=UPI00106DAC33|nr:putative deoxyribonuclease TATDN3 isoform X1 [Dendronephthya gigantea]